MTQLAIGDLFLCEAGIVDLLQLTTNFCFSTRQSQLFKQSRVRVGTYLLVNRKIYVF
jgi:hypothetical protein